MLEHESIRFPEVTVILLPRGGNVTPRWLSQRLSATSPAASSLPRTRGWGAPLQLATPRRVPGPPQLAFLEEGDRWAPDRLARGVAAARRAGAAWAYSAHLRLDAEGRLRGFATDLARDGRATDAARLLLRAAVSHRHPPDLLRAALVARTPASDSEEPPPWAPPAWLKHTA